AEIISRAIGQEKDAAELGELGEALAAVAARMGPGQAAAACGPAGQALAKATDPRRVFDNDPRIRRHDEAACLRLTAPALAALATRMEPKDTRESADTLARAFGQPWARDSLTQRQLLTAMARLNDSEALAALTRATTLDRRQPEAIIDVEGQQRLAEALAAVMARAE